MPTIEISYKDICNLIGKKIPLEKFREELILTVKGEIDDVKGDTIKLDIKETNRPDVWSAEGVARQIRTFLHASGAKEEKLKDSGVKVIVEKSVEKIRPIIACAVVKRVKVNDDILKQLIQLQEKVAENFGRKRREASIGLYNFDKITFPVRYIGADPDKYAFVPLGFDHKASLREIVNEHPKGVDYGHLIAGAKVYPLLIDAKDVIASLPPVINAEHTGRVTQETRNLFVEVTGFDAQTVNTTLCVMVKALMDRGGQAESVTVQRNGKGIKTPWMGLETLSFEKDLVQKRLGVKLKDRELIILLRKAGYNAAIAGKKVKVAYPSYRQDILHPVDVVEDVIISYGYNKVDPLMVEMVTEGKVLEIQQMMRKCAEVMVGSGAQEVLSYTLTNREILERMGLNQKNIVEIENPASKNWSVFRTSILSSLVEFAGANTHHMYPQKVFEMGEVVIHDEKAETKTRNPTMLGYMEISNESDYTRARQVLERLLNSLKVEYQLSDGEHSSCISGRVAAVRVKGKMIGYIGEVHPRVLQKFGIEMPVAAFEIDLSELLNIV